MRLRYRLPLTVLAITLVAGTAAARRAAAIGPAPRADHVVLVSIDGLRPEFYLDPAWPARLIQRMARQGAHAAAVTGVFPSVTYPSHTTLITGALPARHGIYYNSPWEPGGETGRWYWEASAIRVPTLWDAVHAAGGTTAAVGWPVTVGAPIDANVPEVWSLDPGADPIEVIRRASTPGLLAEIEREATGRLTAARFGIESVSRDDRTGDMAAYILGRYRPTLLAVHLIETDHFEHREGREGPTVSLALEAADRAVAHLVEAADRAGILDRTAFVITGDHGFVDIHTRLAPNVWLVGAGLLSDRAPGTGRGAFRAAFHTSAASAFLHLRDPRDGAATARVEDLLAHLPPRVRKLFRVLGRQDLDRLGAAPEAALALAPVPGVTFTSATSGPAVRAPKPNERATHGFLPDVPEVATGLVVWGAGVEPGGRAPRLDLTDVAPLVAELLGLDFEAPDGSAPWGFLRPRTTADR